MSFILSIETATTICSIAIHQNGNLLFHQEMFLEQSHSSKLVPAIENALKTLEISPNDIAAIAISKGPGSYTGLRIGTSTAKGFCYALNIPLIAINTLQTMALKVSALGLSKKMIPLLDARRMEVFTEIFDENTKSIEEAKPLIIEETSFEEHLNREPYLIFGNGMPKFKEICTHKNAIFLNNIYPSAVQVGELAWKKFQRSEFEDMAYFEPFYLKEFFTTAKKLF